MTELTGAVLPRSQKEALGCRFTSTGTFKTGPYLGGSEKGIQAGEVGVPRQKLEAAYKPLAQVTVLKMCKSQYLVSPIQP